MEERTTVVIDIKLDEGDVVRRLAAVNNEMDALKQQNAQLRKDVKSGEKSWEDVSKQLADNEARMKSLKAEQSALSGQVAQATAKNRTYGTSLKEQSALLNDLRNRYQSLNEEQRNSEGGKQMLDQIQALDKELKGADATMGLFQRNVGDYANQVVKALGLTGPAANGATKAITAMGNGMKAVVAIPIVALLSAIVLVAAKVSQAIKGSEEKTMQLKEAFAALRPITDAIKRGFEAFASVIINVVTNAVDGLTTALQWLMDKAQAVGNFFGADWNFADNFREGQAAAKALVESENELIKAKREWGKESAKIDQQVAEIREKAADRERYTAKERAKFLEDAIALETRKAEKEKEFAEWNLRNLKEEAKRSDNAAEMNDRLAEAEVAVIQAETNLANTKRTLNKERQRAVNETKRSTKAMKEHTEAVKDDADAVARAAEEYRKKTIEEIQNAEDAINELIADGFAKREAVEATAYQRSKARIEAAMEAEKAANGEQTALYRAYYLQLEALEEQHQRTMDAIKADREKHNADALANDEQLRWKNRILMAKQMGKDYEKIILEQLENAMMNLTQAADESDEAFLNRRLEAQAAYLEQRKKMSDAEVAMERAKVKAIGDIAGSISDILEKTAGDNEATVRASKVVALAEVAIKQGVAIAEAVASAAAGDPYTYSLRVAVSIASTVAAMAQAISAINSSGFAGGGVVGGFQGATMGSDNTVAAVRGGEMILNARQQRELFEVANGGGTTNGMAAIIEAIAAMPAPVMDYAEFTRFQGRVATYSETSKFR